MGFPYYYVVAFRIIFVLASPEIFFKCLETSEWKKKKEKKLRRRKNKKQLNSKLKSLQF